MKSPISKILLCLQIYRCATVPVPDTEVTVVGVEKTLELIAEQAGRETKDVPEGGLMHVSSNPGLT